jgi:hypothetical protein
MTGEASRSGQVAGRQPTTEIVGRALEPIRLDKIKQSPNLMRWNDLTAT